MRYKKSQNICSIKLSLSFNLELIKLHFLDKLFKSLLCRKLLILNNHLIFYFYIPTFLYSLSLEY